MKDSMIGVGILVGILGGGSIGLFVVKKMFDEWPLWKCFALGAVLLLAFFVMLPPILRSIGAIQ